MRMERMNQIRFTKQDDSGEGTWGHPDHHHYWIELWSKDYQCYDGFDLIGHFTSLSAAMDFCDNHNNMATQ